MSQNAHNKDGWLESQISKAAADYNAGLAREGRAQRRRDFTNRFLRPLFMLALIAAAVTAYIYREEVYGFLEEMGIVPARTRDDKPNMARNPANAEKERAGEGKRGLAGTVDRTRQTLKSVSDEAERRNAIIEETQR